MTRTRYPTKPIACWPKMKELRRARHIRNAAIGERGGVVVVGIVQQYPALLAGIGECAPWMYEPRVTRAMREPAGAAPNMEALEPFGYSRELCSSLRLHLGGFYRGHLEAALKGKKPDFIFQYEICPYVVKTAMAVNRRLNVPMVTMDLVGRYRRGGIDQQYMLEQMHQVIEEMEQASGRRYDDERLIEATRNEWECSVTWAQICSLMRTIPTPIDYRHVQSLCIPLGVDRVRAETVDFYHELLDEVKDRVANGISARGFEDARLLYESFAPFHSAGVLRWPEEYGAIFVTGYGPFRFGVWDIDEEGRWQPGTRWWDRGHELRTRDDALRAMIDMYAGNETYRRSHTNLLCVRTRPEEVLWRYRDWHGDGVVMGVERQCPPSCIGHLEELNLLQQQGIPWVDYSPSFMDVSQFDAVGAHNRISARLEGMGLRKIDLAPAEAGEAE